jgi:hypothetical protein
MRLSTGRAGVVHEDEYILNVRRRAFVRVIVARVISSA